MKPQIVPGLPVSAFVQITPNCNSACPGCSNKFLDPGSGRTQLPPPLGTEAWRAVLSKLRPAVVRLRITGGEPTLHPEFEGILKVASEAGFSFAVFTNGRWREPERLLQALRSTPGFQGLLISLHGSTAAEHEAFSGIKGSFDQTVHNIRLAQQFGVRVHTNTVLTCLNYIRLEELYAFVRTLGVGKLVVARYIGAPIPHIELSPDRLRGAIEQVERMRLAGAQIKHSGCVPQCLVKSTAYGCAAGYTFFTIDPWANVNPCSHSSIVCGNLQHDYLENVWNSDAMRRWRESVSSECMTCHAYAWCHGGCHAAAHLEQQVQDPLMRDPGVTAERSKPWAQSMRLLATGRPVLMGDIRSESYGFLIVKGTHTLPVSHRSKPILDDCDGTLTLTELARRHGQLGLDFVGALLSRGFVRLVGTPRTRKAEIEARLETQHPLVP